MQHSPTISHPVQMLMRSQSSFERLANHNPVLDHIAFYLAVDPFLGPPAYLVSLLLTCRTVHNHLSIANNSRLYADIFRQKFDYAAVERRLSAKWTTASCLAQELCNRFIALKHIRNGKPSLPSDRISLWNAYLMMLENDGRNEQQLLSWANLPHWVLDAVVSRTSSSLRSPSSSPSFQFDPEGISLAVWLLWMTTSKGELHLISSLTFILSPCFRECWKRSRYYANCINKCSSPLYSSWLSGGVS
jgi:hypothetical protein